MRSIAEIANAMDRIAPHRKDVNNLHGPKLIAYKRLEVELAAAKLEIAQQATYSDKQVVFRGEVTTVPAATARENAIRTAELAHESTVAELAALEARK